MQLVTYNDTYASNHDLPIITPHGTYQSIVTQHNLNNIQHNIFLSNEQGKKTELQQLCMQLQLMQQQMEDNEKKRKEDELAALKDKYMEVKQEAHDAQMGGNSGNKEKQHLFVSCNKDSVERKKISYLMLRDLYLYSFIRSIINHPSLHVA